MSAPHTPPGGALPTELVGAAVDAVKYLKARGVIPARWYSCTNCIWLGTLDDASEDGSIADEGKLCPECFSYIEPLEESSR